MNESENIEENEDDYSTKYERSAGKYGNL